MSELEFIYDPALVVECLNNLISRVATLALGCEENLRDYNLLMDEIGLEVFIENLSEEINEILHHTQHQQTHAFYLQHYFNLIDR